MNRRDVLKSMPALAAALSYPVSSPAAAVPIDKKPRLRTAICAYSYREELKSKRMTYDDVIRACVENNVEGLDATVYWFPDTSDAFLMPLRRLAYQMAVEIYSISIRTDMCRPPEAQAAEVEGIRKWVDAAHKLGAGHIRVFGGHVPKGATEDQAADWCAEVLKRSSEYAGSKGVILGLENHGGITERAERIIQIVKKVDSPWVAINLDTGNFRKDAYRQIEMCVPHAVNVQYKTETVGEDGKRGPSDWDRITKMLASAGYKGYFALEYEAKEPAATGVPKHLKRLREVAARYNPA